jgi:phosphatidylglycerophosphate synthase
MLDAVLRPLVDRALHAPAVRVARLGIHPDTITLGGFAIGVLGCIAIALHGYLTGLLLVLINRWMDGMDGAVARAADCCTDLGGYLDIVTDFLLYSGFAFAFALAQPEHAVYAAFLIFSYMGTGSSFLAYAILAAKRGVGTETRGRKAFYYLGGLTEGSETIIAMVLMALLPGWFPLIAVVFGLMCWLTTIGRIAQAWRDFG